MTAPPTFSIVMPVYNRESTIMRAVSSVLAQTHVDFELIVVDDGSTDGTTALIEEIRDERIRIVHGEHAGAGAARNRGAQLARGEFLTFLDSDDEAHEDWLYQLHQATTAETALVTCGCRKVGRTSIELLPEPCGPELGGVTALFLAGCYALRPELFRAAGGFETSLPAAQHTEFAMRLVPALLDGDARIAIANKPLINIYVSPDVAHIRGDHAAVLAGAEYILEHHHDLLARSPSRLAASHSTAGVRAARLRRYRRARGHFVAAVRAQPRDPRSWMRLVVATVPIVRSAAWTPETISVTQRLRNVPWRS